MTLIQRFGSVANLNVHLHCRASQKVLTLRGAMPRDVAARQLVDWVERQAQAAGHRELRLYTNARMTENLRLYPRLGWVQTGRRIEDGLDRVFFHKTVER